MDLQLTGKTALVTGASMGIGRGIARALAAEGVKLCITARRGALLEQLATEIVSAGGVQPHIAIVDLMGGDAGQELARDALRGLGRVDILVNCAGHGATFPIDAPEEQWMESMTLNFTRVRQLTHAILPGMIVQKWGRIINITGKSEQDHGIKIAHSAKAGLHAWAHGLSKEVCKHGITVNNIAPGQIATEQNLKHFPEPKRTEYSRNNIPVGRFGEPHELACVAVFLASPVASYVSGAVIPVDGGLRRYSF